MNSVILRRAEKFTAIVLTAIAIFLNALAALSAGPLWRDEANTVGLATLPSFAEVWRNLEYDSFPILWIAIVRALSSVAGSMNDPAFRITGFVIGLLLIGAIWINARAFKVSYPLLSLALLAMNASVLRWGSSLRAYGLGMTIAVLTIAAMWRYVENPRRGTLLIAMAAATASVHTLFYNAPLVFALCAAGVAVTSLRRHWKSAIGVSTIGLVSAVSLGVYVPTIRRAASWNSLVRIPNYDLGWFFSKLNQSFHVGPWLTTVWLFGVLLAASIAALELKSRNPRIVANDRMPILFAGTTLVMGCLSQYVFLKELSYLTQPWYYLTLIALSVICIDVIFGKTMVALTVRAFRLAVVVVIVCLALPSTVSLARTRMTNVDRIAEFIEQRAGPHDQVVIDPWYLAVSFDRYYRGSAPRTGIPSIEFSRFHRYDRMRPFMEQTDQMDPVKPAIERALKTLTSGGTVYLIREAPFREPKPVRLRKPASIPAEGWKSPAYQSDWNAIFALAVRRHAGTIVTFNSSASSRLSEFESLNVSVLRGWRD